MVAVRIQNVARLRIVSFFVIKSMVTIPAVLVRILRFSVNLLHAVPKPANIWSSFPRVDNGDDDDNSDDSNKDDDDHDCVCDDDDDDNDNDDNYYSDDDNEGDDSMKISSSSYSKVHCKPCDFCNYADCFSNTESSAVAEIIIPCAPARLYEKDNDATEAIHERNNDNKAPEMNRERRHNRNHKERKGNHVNSTLHTESYVIISTSIQKEPPIAIFLTANNEIVNLKLLLKSLTEKTALIHIGVTALRIPLLLWMR